MSFLPTSQINTHENPCIKTKLHLILNILVRKKLKVIRFLKSTQIHFFLYPRLSLCDTPRRRTCRLRLHTRGVFLKMCDDVLHKPASKTKKTAGIPAVFHFAKRNYSAAAAAAAALLIAAAGSAATLLTASAALFAAALTAFAALLAASAAALTALLAALAASLTAAAAGFGAGAGAAAAGAGAAGAGKAAGGGGGSCAPGRGGMGIGPPGGGGSGRSWRCGAPMPDG
ncbi:MAG: hypothetical protein II738_01270 [Clostridia bacterium]|nr:hypothetical protein [Clostridia bacterium]